jgi:hypothetical protein
MVTYSTVAGQCFKLCECSDKCVHVLRPGIVKNHLLQAAPVHAVQIVPSSCGSHAEWKISPTPSLNKRVCNRRTHS